MYKLVLGVLYCELWSDLIILLLQPVISEFYDELVFNEPTEFFYKKLMAGT